MSELSSSGRAGTTMQWLTKITSNTRKAEQSIEQKISTSTRNYRFKVATKVMRAELGDWDRKKVSGHRKEPKFTLLGTTRSDDKQIRIFVLNSTTGEETAVGYQICTPELKQVLKL